MTLGPLVGLAGLATAGTPPYIASPSYQTLGGARGSHGRPHVKIENGLTGGFRSPFVIVDDIADLLARAIHIACDIPVMSVEGGFRTADMLAGQGGRLYQEEEEGVKSRLTQIWRGIASP